MRTLLVRLLIIACLVALYVMAVNVIRYGSLDCVGFALCRDIVGPVVGTPA